MKKVSKGIFVMVTILLCNSLVMLHPSAASPTLSPVTNPEEAGFDSEKLAQMETNIQEQIDAGYSSLSMIVIKDGKIAYQNAFGLAKKYNQSELMSDPIPATVDTMYDMASNTKMFATNFALQKLVTEGKLGIDDLVSDYIDGFADQPDDVIKGKDIMKISDILHHNAGFPADPQYPNQAVAGDLYSQDKATTLAMICKTPLEYEPGTKNIYSDVDYMLLGFIIEAIVGMPLDEYVEMEIYAPLGLTHTMFNPLDKGIAPEQTAATELNGNTRDGVIDFPNIRIETIWGEVHDEKAYYAMEGVSGHAGLFSNTADMAVLLQVMLNGGTYNGVELFSKAVADEFTASSVSNPTYGLGWRVNGGSGYSSFGKYASPTTYGHTGWTGTLTLIDPENNLGIVLLGNRVHSPVTDPAVDPNRFDSADTELRNYSWTVNQVYEALLQDEPGDSTDNNSSENNTEEAEQSESTTANSDTLPQTGQAPIAAWAAIGGLCIGGAIIVLRYRGE
ncbi:penicillin binding protein PBP4B [Culicoidibacter larvae]|uniref:Penicillin binding protein PBP4B n=1 Tax=Culicoidibacter larvae TaxID=2579976 RepID=A0A5R8QA59_9FIRM|nr:penicillin binding protein PBP4B [Culicoidibacter larvae]TLG72747.1 penicillin binding protein PBP4B [Culicoidibacter larvae]